MLAATPAKFSGGVEGGASFTVTASGRPVARLVPPRRRQLIAWDASIAATAIANGLPVATQDGDYDDVPGLTVIRL